LARPCDVDSQRMVVAKQTVQQLVAECGRALVVDVLGFQYPQATNQITATAHEYRKALRNLLYAPVAFLLNLGTIPFADFLDLSVGSCPRDFQLHGAEIDGWNNACADAASAMTALSAMNAIITRRSVSLLDRRHPLNPSPALMSCPGTRSLSLLYERGSTGITPRLHCGSIRLGFFARHASCISGSSEANGNRTCGQQGRYSPRPSASSELARFQRQ